jgi:hypothetical protein
MPSSYLRVLLRPSHPVDACPRDSRKVSSWVEASARKPERKRASLFEEISARSARTSTMPVPSST